jgi:hypothetical protein
MVALGEVEFRKPLRAPSLVQQGINVRQGLDEGLSDGIKTPVVVTNAPGTIGLASKDNGCRMTCRRWLDPAPVEQIQELPAKLRQLAFGQTFDGPRPRHWSIASFEHELDTSVGRQARGGAAENVRVFGLESCESRVINTGKLERSVDEAQRSEVELGAIRQKFDAGHKAGRRRVRTAASTFPTISAGLSSRV